MTAKEKADELIEKFIQGQFWNGEMIVNKTFAKQCALICVEEQIDYCHIGSMEINFWNEVKSELEKL